MSLMDVPLNAYRRSAHDRFLMPFVLAMSFIATGAILSGCASSTTTRTGALSSYEHMIPVHSVRSKALIFANEAALKSVQTVRIEPVVFASGAGQAISEHQRFLIANVVGRTLCHRLATKYDVVEAPSPADLDVKIAITRVAATGTAAAASSVALRAATIVARVPSARLPIGLGEFSAEGEALDLTGVQQAAMSWARGADIITNRARISKIGDAYGLSVAFAGDMARLIETGKNPLHDVPAIGTHNRGRKRPSPACTAYGKAANAGLFVGGFFGAPPEWSDHGSVPTPAPKAHHDRPSA